jgi:hypothetical protein
MEGNIWIATPVGIEMFEEIPGLVVLKAPGLTLPENGSTELLPDDVTLTWNQVTGAASYTIQINTLDDFTDPWVTASDITIPSYAPSTLVADQQYFWRVAGIRGVETGPWSEVWNFTTAIVDAIPPVDAIADFLVVYPNPATDRIIIHGTTGEMQIRVNVYTVNGQLVASPYTFYNNGGYFKGTIDISDKSKYPTGVYIMQVAGETFSKMFKITAL